MARRVAIGVLGCAAVARRSLIPAILQLPGRFELAAVASRQADKAAEFAARFRCRGVVGYERLVADPGIEALYVPLPTGLHAEWIGRALRAGKHVYAEKSLALNAADARRLVGLARRRSLALMEGFMFQYHGQHRVVRDLLEGGEIGGLRHFFSSFGFPPLAGDNFRYDEALGGGALLDAAAYPLRATHFLLGEDFAVRAAAFHRDPRRGVVLYGSAFLSDARGIGASLAFGFDNFYQCRYELWGATGKIVAERAFTPPPDLRPRIVVEKPEGSRVILAEADDHFVRALEEFHGLVSGEADRERQYRAILLQSLGLERIKRLGGPS